MGYWPDARAAGDGAGGEGEGEDGRDALLRARVQRAAGQWRRLGLYLRSLAPRDVLRLVLLALAVYAVWWLATSTWPALLPFVAGGIIGYAVLPIVDALDRVIPRPLAALVTMAGVLALLGLLLAVLIPPLAQQLFLLFGSLPSPAELRDALDRLRTQMGSLPLPVQDFIRDAGTRASTNLRANLEGTLSRSVELTVATLLGLLNAISFFLGLLVIPTWLLTIVSSQRRVARELNRLLPDWLEPDFWAVVRIVDHAFGAFIRGQLLVSLAVGLLTYAGLQGLAWLGLPVGYPVVLSVVAALFQLVPELGPLVSAVVAAVVGFSASPETGLGVLGLYFVVQRLVGAFVGSRVERQVTDLHPAILVLVIVALSQLGPLWIFVAAPVTAVARDLWRYAFGRLADPPRPAGLLPGEPARVSAPRATVVPAGAAVGYRRVPLVYQRAQMTAAGAPAAPAAPPPPGE
jgi:predicted PurR-regulated permease PerM